MNARFRRALALLALAGTAVVGGCNHRTIPEGRVVVEDNSPLPVAKGKKPPAAAAAKSTTRPTAPPAQATQAKPNTAPPLGTYVSPSTAKKQLARPTQATLPPGDND